MDFEVSIHWDLKKIHPISIILECLYGGMDFGVSICWDLRKDGFWGVHFLGSQEGWVLSCPFAGISRRSIQNPSFWSVCMLG